MKKIQAILFDCDGTLVDTEIIHASAGKEIFATYGIVQHDEHEFMGVHLTDILTILNERHQTDITVDGYLEVYIDYMLKAIPLRIRLLDESRDYLRDLHARGFPMAVGSNGQRDVVVAELDATELTQYFPVIVTADDGVRPKPAGDIYLKCMDGLGIDDPESCIVVEDSVTGIKAAVAGGMIPVGYTGLNPHPEALEQKLVEAGAYKVIKHLNELDFLMK